MNPCSPAAWLALVFLIGLVRLSSAATDSRCDAFVCDLSQTDPSLYDDSSECDSATCTQSCLGDPSFASLLADLGAGSAIRPSESVWLPITNWLSSQFINQIFKILAMEVLRYKVRSAVMDDGWSILCCPEIVMWLERWPTDPFPDDVQGTMTVLPNGYTGFAGLYIPNYLLQQYPLATAYRAYSLLPSYDQVSVPAGSVPCNMTLIDDTLPCDDANRYCNESVAYWPNTSCVDGRYIPPQCAGSNLIYCQEVLYGEPIWDTGFFESVIKNLKLNMTVVYVGNDRLFPLIEEWAAARKNFIFYMSGPDPILSAVPSQPINFPPRTLFCDQHTNVDPTLSLANCSYPSRILSKTARADRLESQPDLKRLFDSIQISSSLLDALMATHTSGGGTLDVWNASCQWVQNNADIWKLWIVNTPPPVASSSNTVVAAAAGVAGGLVAIIAIGAGIVFWRQRQEALKAIANAPTAAPLALIFTDVESSTNLWEAHPEMAVAMEMHHSIIREVIEEHQCYEVKTIGDSFMIACPTITDAVELCAAIQRRLHAAEWPEPLRQWKGDEDETPGMWNGLRVRAGVHWCKEVEPKLDDVHGRYDYYGHDVNVSARVESMAAGGQTTMTRETFEELAQDPDFGLLAEDVSCEPFCKGVELKGVAGKVTLYSMVPVELAGRHFKPIPGTEPCTTDAAECVQDAHSAGSGQSVATSLHEGATTQSALRKYVEDLLSLLPNSAEKDRGLTRLLVKHKVQLTEAELNKIKFPRKMQLFLKLMMDSVPGLGVPSALDAMMSMSRNAASSSFNPPSVRRRSSAYLAPPNSTTHPSVVE